MRAGRGRASREGGDETIPKRGGRRQVLSTQRMQERRGRRRGGMRVVVETRRVERERLSASQFDLPSGSHAFTRRTVRVVTEGSRRSRPAGQAHPLHSNLATAVVVDEVRAGCGVLPPTLPFAEGGAVHACRRLPCVSPLGFLASWRPRRRPRCRSKRRRYVMVDGRQVGARGGGRRWEAWRAGAPERDGVEWDEMYGCVLIVYLYGALGWWVFRRCVCGLCLGARRDAGRRF